MIKKIFPIVLVLALSSCASREASLIRTELATEARIELDQASAETQGLIDFAIETKAKEAYADLDKKFRIAFEAAKNLSNPADSAELSSKATAAYFREKELIDKKVEQDALRLSLIRVKIDNGSTAVQAINQMAETEKSIDRETLRRSLNTDEVRALVDQITARVESYTSSPELGGK